MISYRSDREISKETAFVSALPALSGRAAARPTRALRPALTKRRAVDFCRVAGAL
jgi:hypothetical protein